MKCCDISLYIYIYIIFFRFPFVLWSLTRLLHSNRNDYLFNVKMQLGNPLYIYVIYLICSVEVKLVAYLQAGKIKLRSLLILSEKGYLFVTMI